MTTAGAHLYNLATPALACFTLCYILAGTFRSPPTGPLSRPPTP